MAKCPVSFDCGSEFVYVEEGNTLEFEVTNAVEGTVCVYNIYTDPEEKVEKYTFEVKKMSSDGFLGGVYSNQIDNVNDAVSGVVKLDFELKEKSK